MVSAILLGSSNCVRAADAKQWASLLPASWRTTSWAQMRTGICGEQRRKETTLHSAQNEDGLLLSLRQLLEPERGREADGETGEERGTGKGTAGNPTRGHSTGTPQIFAKGMICFPSNWKPSTPIYNTQLLSSRKGGGQGASELLVSDRPCFEMTESKSCLHFS